MRVAALAGAGLVASLLLPLLFIAALFGGLAPTTADIAGLPTPGAAGALGAGCSEPDPTGGRCLTPTTRHAYDEIARAFGPFGADHPIRNAACWDAHAWNPDSDHPRGRACDFFPTRAGTFPTGTDLANGWALANWLRTHADALDVAYVIWQGRIWSRGDGDRDGWGRRYTGGGVYDPADATGGHYDHIHLSVGR